MANGLEGVVAAETVLSHTDQANAMIWVRGIDLPTLASRYGFEAAVALLWDGFAGDGLSGRGLSDAFGEARIAAYEALPAWLPSAAGRPLFEGVRIALAAQSDSAEAADLVAALTVAV